jgi:hypothetical protein
MSTVTKKVLVRSIYREVVAKVGEMPTRDHNNRPAMAPMLRKFLNYQCYMTPEEAEFLVDSNENRKMRTTGNAAYFYPAGFPVPVDVDHEGPLSDAVSAENAMTQGDPGASLAAKEQLARAEAALAAQEKGANSAMERELGAKSAASV